MKNTEMAFFWITELLEKLEIPYQITGGLAGRVYGSQRELADIDIDVPEESIQKIALEAKQWIIYGPARYKDDSFDIQLMTIKKNKQEIDIAGFGTGKLYNSKTAEWVDDNVNLSEVKIYPIFGKNVPVVCKQNLIAYKSKINRAVDIEDIKQITRNL